jgi:hypothetical protein
MTTCGHLTSCGRPGLNLTSAQVDTCATQIVSVNHVLIQFLQHEKKSGDGSIV